MNDIDEEFLRDVTRSRDIFARAGEKWTLYILAVLRSERRIRFNDLHRNVSGISQRVLTTNLRNLERDGFIVRIVHATVPPRVEYELSERGHALKQILQSFGAWIETHGEAINVSRRHYDESERANHPAGTRR